MVCAFRASRNTQRQSPAPVDRTTFLAVPPTSGQDMMLVNMSIRDGLRCWARLCLPPLWFMAVAALSAGCASSHQTGDYAGSSGGGAPPRPPLFLSGSVAVLLTNADGFNAHLLFETRRLAGPAETLSGELFGQGSKLFFMPDPGGNGKKRQAADGLSFFWDVAEGRGYVMSEPLQGYAPMASDLRFTNVVTQAGAGAPLTIEGHRCQPEDAAVSSNDGLAAAFQVWRAADLRGFALRCASDTNSPTFTLSFSKVRLQPPPGELFRPPEGFTKYDSVENMMAELAMRRHNLRNKPSTDHNDWNDVIDRERRAKGAP